MSTKSQLDIIASFGPCNQMIYMGLFLCQKANFFCLLDS